MIFREARPVPSSLSPALEFPLPAEGPGVPANGPASFFPNQLLIPSRHTTDINFLARESLVSTWGISGLGWRATGKEGSPKGRWLTLSSTKASPWSATHLSRSSPSRGLSRPTDPESDPDLPAL